MRIPPNFGYVFEGIEQLAFLEAILNLSFLPVEAGVVVL